MSTIKAISPGLFRIIFLLGILIALLCFQNGFADGDTNNGSITSAEGSQPVPSMENIPDNLALTVDVSPAPLNQDTNVDTKLVVTPLSAGTMIRPLGITNDCFIIPIDGQIHSSQLADAPNEVGLNLNAHFEDKITAWKGTGLVPIQDTNYTILIQETGLSEVEHFMTDSSPGDGNGSDSSSSTTNADNVITNDALSSILSKSKLLSKEFSNTPDLETRLTAAVSNILIKSATSPLSRALILKEWPNLKNSIEFSSEQQIAFYNSILNRNDISIDEWQAVYGMANSTDSPPEVRNAFNDSNAQMAHAIEIEKKTEATFVSLLSNPPDNILLQDTATKDQLLAPVNYGSDDLQITENDAQKVEQAIPCIKANFQIYQDSWKRLRCLPKIRSDLANGKLIDADSVISSAPPENDPSTPLTPGQSLAAQAWHTNLMLYERQKKAAQDLLDNAERLRLLGRHSSEVLQDYKNAYEIDDDPAILEKIKDFNNESLGL